MCKSPPMVGNATLTMVWSVTLSKNRKANGQDRPAALSHRQPVLHHATDLVQYVYRIACAGEIAPKFVPVHQQQRGNGR